MNKTRANDRRHEQAEAIAPPIKVTRPAVLLDLKGLSLQAPEDFLAAENVSLRLFLAQAEINARGSLVQAGIDAKEREASDKLQRLILEELHHRIKNTLATVSGHMTCCCRPLDQR